MTANTSSTSGDRIQLSRKARRKAAPPVSVRPRRRSMLWKVVKIVAGCMILLWGVVQLGQASTSTKKKSSTSPIESAAQSDSSPIAGSQGPAPENAGESASPDTKNAQGPALGVPREVLEMLALRKHDLDQREETVREHEARLLIVRAEVEKLLAQNEAMEKRLQDARAKEVEQTANTKTVQAKALLEKERLAEEKKNKLGRMYETMPSEEAAVRLERMSDTAALEILRLVKPKTAGAILGQVKADRAAKLTEQLLAQTRQ
ncbi:MAG: hypothetical protein OEY86_17480 [Nitrospira sp.]|nr:hypothetical protein [Nitrospira sp.]